MRVYANRQNPGSVAGDSGVTSQIDDGYSKRISSVVQFGQQLNQSIPFSSTVRFNDKLTDNPSRNEQLSRMQYSARTGIVSTTPAVLYDKTNVTRRGSEYEGISNSPRDAKNQQSRFSRTSLPQIQRSQKDIRDDKFVSPLNLENNRNLPDRYLTASIFENLALNRSLPLSQYNKLSPSHMEPIQNAAAYLPTNEALISENILQRNSLNIPQSQIPPTSAQCQSDIPIIQRTLYRDTDLYKNVPRSNFRFSNLGSVPGKITKADSPRMKMPVELSPRYHGQIDCFSNHGTTVRSYNDLKSNETYGHFVPRDNSLRRNVPYSTNSMTIGNAKHGLSNVPRSNNDLDEETRTTRKLENELDRYINKIRNLHRELDAQSLEEHDYEQNTSGDLLNVTLSDDGTDYPTDKAKDERVSREVAKVLALADDLASNKPTFGNAESSRDDKDKRMNGTLHKNYSNTEDKRTNLNSVTRYDVLSDKTLETTTARLEKVGINDDVASRNPELERSDKNIRDIEKEKRNNVMVKNIRDSNGQEEAILENDAVENNEPLVKNHEQRAKEDRYVLQKGTELDISQEFFDVESLNPWDVERMEKEVVEVQSDGMDTDLIENDENKEKIVIVDEDEDEKLITETSVIPENEVPENLSLEHEDAIIDKIDTIERQDANKNLEIISNVGDSSENGQKVESIQDIQLASDHIEYSNDTKVEVIDEDKDIEENGRMVDVDDIQRERLSQENDTSVEYYASNEQNVQELDRDDGAYRSDVNQEFVDPNQQYGYDQNPLVEDNDMANQDYEGYIKDDYEAIIADENAIKTDEEYLEQSYEQYPPDPEQEYMEEENQDYREDRDKSNVYDDNYKADRVNDNEINDGYLVERYNTLETDQDAVDVETDQNAGIVDTETDQNAIDVDYNVDNTNDRDSTDNFANNDIEKESIIRSNVISDNDQLSIPVEQTNQSKKKKDIINSLLDSDTESTIERNISNTESDFDFQ